MNCSICNVWIADTDAAVAADWLPGFWDGEEEHGPCCLRCWLGNIIHDPESGECVRVEKGKVA